jgi:hypothetical protein
MLQQSRPNPRQQKYRNRKYARKLSSIHVEFARSRGNTVRYKCDPQYRRTVNVARLRMEVANAAR